MSDDTDFDVRNYSVEDLLSIMDALENTPLSKSDIIDVTQKYIDKYTDNPKFKKFFFDVRIKLLDEKSRDITENVNYSDLNKTTEEMLDLVKKRYINEDRFIDEEKTIKGELQFPQIVSKPVSFIQGNINPTWLNTTSHTITISSDSRPYTTNNECKQILPLRQLDNDISYNNKANIVMDAGTPKYVFNNRSYYNSDIYWQLRNGIYLLKDIPEDYAITFLSSTTNFNISVPSTSNTILKSVTINGITKEYYFYWGDVTLTITSNFNTMSYHSINDGYMGGEDKFLYINSQYVDTNIPIPYYDPNGISFDTRVDSPSDFTFILSEPKNNVVKIAFKDVTLKQSWEVFNRNYGTNYFITNHDATPCEIEEGNYTTGSEILSVLNNAAAGLDWDGGTDVKKGYTNIQRDLVFSFNSRRQKFSIENTGGTITTLEWYVPVASVSLCMKNGPVGQKINYNLGWLLGFRKTAYKIAPGGSITGESIINFTGPTHLFISLDDFCNNKPNTTNISNKNNRESFKMPSYYNKNTMRGDCDVPDFNLKQDGCRPRQKNMDLITNLTKKQQYTIEQLKLAMSGKIADRYNNANITDYFAKINIPNFQYNKPLSLPNVGGVDRVYFGPVSITKFKIRLLDNRGFIIDLQDVDWSFDMVITQLKSYGPTPTSKINKNQQKNTYEGMKAALEKRPLTDDEIQGLQDRLFAKQEEEKKEDYTLPENVYKEIVDNYYKNITDKNYTNEIKDRELTEKGYIVDENINDDDFNETFENEIIDRLEEQGDDDDED
jgi:hypothetical protein